MRRFLAIAAVLAVSTIIVNGKEKGSEPNPNKDNPEAVQQKTNPPAPIVVVHEQAANSNGDGAKDHPQSYLLRLFAPENLPNIGLLLAGVVGIVVAIGTLKHMQESSERELRAYVIAESGTIFNVADPVPLFPGQKFEPPSEARITNLAVGPGVRIQIKNAGQTPAYDVAHWCRMIFREFPLNSVLPANDPPQATSTLGPGIPSTILLFLPQPLTAAQIADLRVGTGAVYVYGGITYRDTFGKKWYTRYRLIHHAIGGAIGVSTDLTFALGGNEAN
jgi:hypothetical protein